MFRAFILGALLYSSKCFITTQLGTTEALSLQIISQRVSSTFGVPHTKLQQRCRACSWAGVHVEARRACPVREELAAGLTAPQGYGAPLRLPRPRWRTFASFSKHRVLHNAADRPCRAKSVTGSADTARGRKLNCAVSTVLNPIMKKWVCRSWPTHSSNTVHRGRLL